MIHFWIVEMCYPDRVMRQLGYYQGVPPHDPLPWSDIQKFRNVNHTSRDKFTNWAEKWSTMIEAPGFEAEENRPYSDETYPAYLDWYWKRGKHTLYPEEEDDEALRQPLPQTQPDQVENLAYVPRGAGIARAV